MGSGILERSENVKELQRVWTHDAHACGRSAFTSARGIGVVGKHQGIPTFENWQDHGQRYSGALGKLNVLDTSRISNEFENMMPMPAAAALSQALGELRVLESLKEFQRIQNMGWSMGSGILERSEN